MKIAHLVQTHRNPELLKRKIELLSSEDSAFFVHVDRKSDIGRFSEIRGDNVFLCGERVPVYWAEYSMVEAILVLMRQALNNPGHYDYFILSTGSDYPIRRREYIHDFFEINRGREFISSIKLPDGEACGPVCREYAPQNGCAAYVGNKYYASLNTLRGRSEKPVRKLALKILARSGLARRDFKKKLNGLEPYAGNAGWALTRDACLYIIDFIENNPRYCNYFENVFAPDEIFFHTILGNSFFKSRICRHLTYEDWSVAAAGGEKYSFLERLSNKGGHPAVLDYRHLSLFEEKEKFIVDDIYGAGEMLFARKFDDNSLDLVSRVEEMIRKMQQKKLQRADRAAVTKDCFREFRVQGGRYA